MRKTVTAQERKRLEKMKLWEKKARESGYVRIAGVDEAGRGPLAGPVVAAACILPENVLIPGLNDSKKLLPGERLEIFQYILSIPSIEYGIGIIDALTIDQVNILQASLQAMLAAMAHLTQAPDYILVDGNKMPATPIPGEAIIKGDSLSQSIAAASIIAKVTRDQLMDIFHERWPNYGFQTNKGYATEMHLEALAKFGPCPIHRMSFSPMRSESQLELQFG